MSLVTRRTESGLILSEQEQDGAGLRRALKQIDPDLRLWAPDAMSPYWRVLLYRGEDKPAETILTWMDYETGEPLPLSSGVLERVERLRRDARNTGKSADELNAEHVERLRRQRDEDREAIGEEYRPYLERGRVGVGMSTLKRRPYWQRKYRGGDRP